MKKNVLFLFAVIFLIACSNRTKKIIEKKFPDGHPQIVKYYKHKNDTLLLFKTMEYYPNHFKKSEGKLKDGERHGLWKVWYDNGNKWSQGWFKHGLRDGESTTWYRNGNIRYEGKYHKNKKSGEWKFWDKEGNLVKTVNFDKKK